MLSSSQILSRELLFSAAPPELPQCPTSKLPVIWYYGLCIGLCMTTLHKTWIIFAMHCIHLIIVANTWCSGCLTPHTKHICLLSIMTPHLCGPASGMSSYLLTEWVITLNEYACVCVTTTVLLVSSYGVGAVGRNGSLCCPAGRPDPSGSSSISTPNPNVKRRPPAKTICHSLWVKQPKYTHTCRYAHLLIVD